MNEIFYRVPKNANFYAFGEGAMGLDRENIKWLLTRLANHFESKQICFIQALVKSFSWQSFKQNYFLSQIERVVLRETAS